MLNSTFETTFYKVIKWKWILRLNYKYCFNYLWYKCTVQKHGHSLSQGCNHLTIVMVLYNFYTNACPTSVAVSIYGDS